MEDKRLKFEKGKQKELLETVIKNEFRYLNDFVGFLGFSRRNVFDWRLENILLSKNVFEKICKIFPEYQRYRAYIVEELPENWSLEKGRKANIERLKKLREKINESLLTGDAESLKKYLSQRLHKKDKLVKFQLKESDILAAPKSLDVSKVLFSWKDSVKGITLPTELSADLCYVLGAHTGDGSMNIYRRSYQVDYFYRCGGHQINDKEWYDTVFVPLKKKLFNLNVTAKNTVDGGYSVKFSSKAVVCFYHEVCGLPLGKKSAIADIPEIVLNSGLKFVLAFISGVFDTDFCIAFKNKSVVHSYPIIDLRTKSKYLVKTISVVLQQIGITFSTGKYIQIDERFSKPITMYGITIQGQRNIDRWFELIGSRNPNYISKYLIWKKFGFCPPTLNYLQRKEILDGKVNPLTYYSGRGRI